MCRACRLLAASLLSVALIAGAAVAPLSAAELKTFAGARLVDDPANDGDSFIVEAAGTVFHVRLYFVDSPETKVSFDADAQRVRAQTRYFGLPDAGRTIHYGNEARQFVARVLQRPFTVRTAFAGALGRSSRGRVYAFVTDARGRDLATLLVDSGLARVHGAGRGTPDGAPRAEMVARLRDRETAAMLKRVGVWSESDAELLATARAAQRRDERALEQVRHEAEDTAATAGRLDINTATETQLQSLHGIGPVLAKRIVAGRPYRTVDDLVKVQGIGPKTVDRLRPYVAADRP